MRRTVIVISLSLSALCIVLLLQATFFATPASALPPLSLEGLMDEKLPEATGGPDKSKVDNSACFVCHNDFVDEPLVKEHAEEAIGCVACHGESHDHRNDEAHLTPPSKMHPRDEIDKACNVCHDRMHDVPAKKVIARWLERCPDQKDMKDLVCTDCHNEHRMEKRSIVWDRKTGKVLTTEDSSDDACQEAEEDDAMGMD